MFSIENYSSLMRSSEILPPGKLSNKLKIIKKIGQGTFGTIYSVAPKNSNQKKKIPNTYAIKIEEITKNEKVFNSLLLREARFLYTLKDSPGFPKVYYCNTFENKNIMIMSELGENLENTFTNYQSKFSLACVLEIGCQVLERLEELSNKGIIHRDLKPENLLIGKNENNNKIFLIDFGLSKFIYNDKNDHIPFRKNIGLIGTPRYTSINSHLEYEQSRRDDLESLGYILIYFLKGKLPWMEIKCEKKKLENLENLQKIKNNLILKCKQSTHFQILCKDLPDYFIDYFNYVKNLSFCEKPDYKFLINLLKKMRTSNNNFVFDWLIQDNKKKISDGDLFLNEQEEYSLSLDIKLPLSANFLDKKKPAKNLMQNSIPLSNIPRFQTVLNSSMLQFDSISLFKKNNADFENDVSIIDEQIDLKNCRVVLRSLDVKTKIKIQKTEKSENHCDSEEEKEISNKVSNLMSNLSFQNVYNLKKKSLQQI